MSAPPKELAFDAAKAVFRRLRDEGKTIVQCHGTFDLLHPGHVIHFQEASELGDLLVVTVTGERHVNKGPGRPFFGDDMRTASLAALACVDHVVVVPFPTAVEAIECVRPHIYCKGKEYENPQNDLTGNIVDDVRAVERLGGQVAYVGSVVYSSTRVLNRHFGTMTPAVKTLCRELSNTYGASSILESIESFRDLRVLLVGDIIFDRYNTVDVQGLTSKDRILSGRMIASDSQTGGALAVFRHLQQFVGHVALVSLVGAEPWVEGALGRFLGAGEDHVLRDERFTTVVKERFVEPLAEGKELTKLFSVNYVDDCHPGEDIQRQVIDRLDDMINDYDLVMVMDFGHGLMAKPVRELVQDRARFLALNCQTNSNNHGFNIINRQYRRADSFSLDETEIRLAQGSRHLNFRKALAELRAEFGARYAWLTRGAVETLGVTADDDFCACPPFEVDIVDTIGAGDAFCTLASLAAVRHLPVNIATFLGQLAGAQAVRVVGNSEPVRKPNVLKGVSAMLSF